MAEIRPSAPTEGRRPFWMELFAPDKRLLWLSGVALLLVATVWTWFTPAGLLGKADAIGYAVCHRITVRSFLFPDGRQMPLCARCSGTFLGVLIGLWGPRVLLGRRRALGFPPAAILAVMLGMSLLWALDGTNSFLHLMPASNIPCLYTPTNFLRLLTGMLHGITLGSLTLPIANATLWADATGQRTVEHWWHLGLLYAIGGLMIAMILSGAAVFLYPLAVLSAVGVLAILGTISTLMLTTLTGRENAAHTLWDALPLIFGGLALAFVLIGGIDALRYAIFGSWGGFAFPEA